MPATLDYTFTQEDAEKAYRDWGCNCGPSSLAFALRISLDEVRPLIPGFNEKRYTSPSMMKAALAAARRGFQDTKPADVIRMFANRVALVRVQWTGPWTAADANPRWAYRQTHWIATYLNDGLYQAVFDINGGILEFPTWKTAIVPEIVASIPRADGGWFPTHIWRLDECP